VGPPPRGNLFIASCHQIIEFMPLEFEWGSCQTFPDLTGVFQFLNMFAKMSASPTGVGLPNDLEKI
jgi:hypothetical protein